MKDEQLHKDALWIYLPFLWLKVRLCLGKDLLFPCITVSLSNTASFTSMTWTFLATYVGQWNWQNFILWVRKLRFILIFQSKFACIQSDGFIYSHLFANKLWVPTKGNATLSIRKRLEPLGFNFEKNRHNSCHRGPFAGQKVFILIK
jgi:hypothetical protein